MDGCAITNILSGYIGMRDNFRTTVTRRGGGTVNDINQFNGLVNNAHMELFGELPDLNLAELEAFAELANSRLSWVRSQRHRKG